MAAAVSFNAVIIFCNVHVHGTIIEGVSAKPGLWTVGLDHGLDCGYIFERWSDDTMASING